VFHFCAARFRFQNSNQFSALASTIMATTAASEQDAAAMRPDSVASGELTSDVTATFLVLSCLVGDISSMCAAACVSRAWREAASTPSLWVCIGPLLGDEERLDDVRLQSLAVRAAGAGGFTSLELHGTSVTDSGLMLALRHQRNKVEQFDCSSNMHSNNKLTGIGVGAALLRSRGQIRVLNVRGIPALNAKKQNDILNGTEPKAALHNMRSCVIRTLQTMMAPQCSIDVTDICPVAFKHNEQIYKCGRMCTPTEACHGCKSMRCNAVTLHNLTACEECLNLFCGRCMSDYGPVCGDCADIGALDGWDPEDM